MKSTIHTTKTTLPYISKLDFTQPILDYADAYTCSFQSVRTITVEDLLGSFFHSSTPKIRLLLKLRDGLVKPFGLKPVKRTTRHNKEGVMLIKKGEKLGMMEILDYRQNEILLGTDDKHLSFRLSFLLEEDRQEFGRYRFTVSTIVIIHNLLGRIYFKMINPFHNRIVPIYMEKTITRLIHYRNNSGQSKHIQHLENRVSNHSSKLNVNSLSLKTTKIAL